MTVTQAFRYKLDPTVRQRRLLARAAGAARDAFNWGLNLCKRRLNAGQPVPHAAEMHRLCNAEKPQRSWVYGVSKCCGQEALRDLDRAFANFWRGRQEGRRGGFPHVRRKHGRRDSFRLTGTIRVHPQSVTLPRLGSVRTKETSEKFRGRMLSATVSREADRWYVSLAVEGEREEPQPVDGPVVGIDLGLQSFAVVSDGALLESPKPLAKAQRRLRHWQRLHSPQATWLPQSAQVGGGAGSAPSSHPLPARGFPAQGDHWPGENQVGHGCRARPARIGCGLVGFASSSTSTTSRK